MLVNGNVLSTVVGFSRDRPCLMFSSSTSALIDHITILWRDSPLKTAAAAVHREIEFAFAACICRIQIIIEICDGVVSLWELSRRICVPIREYCAENIDLLTTIQDFHSSRPSTLIPFCLSQLDLTIVSSKFRFRRYCFVM